MSSFQDKSMRNRRLIQTAGVAGVLLLFDFVYNQFSHGIGSWYMHLVPVLVFLAGVIPALVVYRVGEPQKLHVELWRMGLSTFVVAMILQGVMEIAGSEARSLLLFVAAGALLWLIAAVLYVLMIARKGKSR